jgi:hypothetical protein
LKRAIRATFVDWKDDRSCIDQTVGPAVERASSRKPVIVTDGFIWLHLPTSSLAIDLPAFSDANSTAHARQRGSAAAVVYH